MAPPTLPLEQKKRRGTLRADRVPGGGAALVAVERAQIDEPPPANLKDEGKAEWERALRVCPWIALSDLTALRFLCEAVDRRKILMDELVGSETTLFTSTGYAYVHPADAALGKTEDRIAKWMQQLGMTPSARGALGVAEVKTVSALDKLSAARRARQGGLPASSPPSTTPPSKPATARKSSRSSTPTDASPRTASPARRARRSTPESGSDGSSETPSPEVL